MNKERRKRLQKIYDTLQELQSDLSVIKDEEESYRDDMPDNLQGSDKYQKADAAVDALDEADTSIDEALSSIETAME